MRRKIPNTGALLAFETAARHQSFTKAAVELNQTQSAVCRQIAALESFLGVRLFRRSQRGVALTDAGLAYSRQVAARLDEVERDALSLMAHRGLGSTVDLAVVPTFATRWLLPRLAGFLRETPDLAVNMETRTRPFLFEGSGFDAALYCGDGRWPGTEAVLLMPENLVPACSPDLLPAGRRLAAADFARLPLLQQSTRPYAWRQWFGSLGLTVAGDMTGPRFELFSMLAEAAMHRMGIALLPPMLIEEELASGRLVVPFAHEYRSERTYYLIRPPDQPESAGMQRFRAWLVGEAARYRRESGLD